MQITKYENIKFKKTNRQKSQTPRKSAGWCIGCDRVYLTGYSKCPECGTRNTPFRLKNEPI